jgi:hypothetical protein
MEKNKNLNILAPQINLLVALNLQAFAAGENNDLPARRFEKQFKDTLDTVYNHKAYFGDMSAGGIETLDGVSNNATAFSVKTSDIPVTIGAYSTGANVGFGTGTFNTGRFGPATEIIYIDTDVPYDGPWAFNEGIDRHTVNNDFEATIADRLVLQARAVTRRLDMAASAALKAAADSNGLVVPLTAYTDAAIITLFNAISARMIDLEVDTTDVVAKVDAQLYNSIVNGTLTTTNKNSTVNIDANGVTRFKGIIIEGVPAALMPSGSAAIVYPRNLGKVFTGISTTRSIETDKIDGVYLQGDGKYGTFILEDNKKAVIDVTAPVGP